MPLPAMRTRVPPVALRCYPPIVAAQHLTALEFTAWDIDALTFGSALAAQGGVGGFDTLTASFVPPYAPRGSVYAGRGQAWYPSDFLGFGHVEFWLYGAKVWEGRLQMVQRPRGFVQQLVARGYAMTALQDMPFFSSDTTAGRSSLTVLKLVLSQSCPAIEVTNIAALGDPGVAHTYAEFDSKFPAQVIDQLAKEGGAEDAVWDFVVGLDRIPAFVPRVTPTIPDYHVPWGPAVVEWLEDYTDVYGSVKVQYSDAGTAGNPTTLYPSGTNAYVNDTSFPGRMGGMSRYTLVQATGVISTGSATQYAGTYLATHAFSRVSAKLQYTAGEGPEQIGGVPVQPWLVKAGQWVQVGRETPQIIVRAEYDVGSQTLDLDLGLPLPYGLAELVHAMRVADQHYVYNTSPTTGATRP